MGDQIQGLSQVEQNLNALFKNVQKANADAFSDVCMDLLQKSVLIIPDSEKSLRDNGNINADGTIVGQSNENGGVSSQGNIEAKDNVFTAKIEYNSPDAVRKHENPKSNNSEENFTKYLEQPFRENINKYINQIADANRNVLK